MISFSPPLQSFLLHYIKEEFYLGTKRETFIDRPFGEADLRFFAKGVAQLSDYFTEERSDLPSTYLRQPALRAAYLLYFLPINFAKAVFVLERIPKVFWKKSSLRVLDLGSGPGSASLALLTLLKETKVELSLTLVDQDKNILRDAEALLRSLKFPHLTLQTISQEARRFRFLENYDLILMSHVLNEWVQSGATERAEWLLPRLKENLTEDGIVAILEPALKRPTRELMALRDHLLESKGFSVIAPCLHEEICPMLAATQNDWCHFYVSWEEPEYLKQLDRLVQNDNRFLKVAYLLLGRASTYSKLLPRERKVFRVVSNRMATRGKTEIILCGPPGRIRLMRLDRDRSPKNAELDRIRRGDLVEVPEYEGTGYEVNRNFRITKNTPLHLTK